MSKTTHSRGFIPFLVLLIIAVIILFLSSANLRNTISRNNLETTAVKISEQAVDIYNDHIALPLHTFLVEPVELLWQYTDQYVITVLTEYLHNMTNDRQSKTPPQPVFVVMGT